jgi:hypothetical protein
MPNTTYLRRSLIVAALLLLAASCNKPYHEEVLASIDLKLDEGDLRIEVIHDPDVIAGRDYEATFQAYDQLRERYIAVADALDGLKPTEVNRIAARLMAWEFTIEHVRQVKRVLNEWSPELKTTAATDGPSTKSSKRLTAEDLKQIEQAYGLTDDKKAKAKQAWATEESRLDEAFSTVRDHRNNTSDR